MKITKRGMDINDKEYDIDTERVENTDNEIVIFLK